MSTTARPDVPFRYRASTDAGVMRDGVVRAVSREAALRELRRQALVPVELEPVAAPSAGAVRWSISAGSRPRAVALWTRTLATMIEAGAPLDRALDAAGTQVVHGAARTAVESVRVAVRGGSALAAAMRAQPGTFGPLHVGMVQAGEASGSLGPALMALAGYLDEDETRRADRNAALVYPVLMAVVSTLGILVLLLFVVPRFAGLLGELDGQLPWSTRVLVGLGHVVGQYWWAMAGVLAVTGTVLARWGATEEGRMTLAGWRLSAPVLGTIERGVGTARLTRALGLLLRGGMPLLPALALARAGVDNPVLAAALVQATDRVARGDALAAALTGIVTPLAVQLLSVGEQNAQLDALALRAADVHDDAVRRTLRTLTSMLEPATILLFGGIVGFVALAMLQAIYAVNAGLQ